MPAGTLEKRIEILKPYLKNYVKNGGERGIRTPDRTFGPITV